MTPQQQLKEKERLYRIYLEQKEMQQGNYRSLLLKEKPEELKKQEEAKVKHLQKISELLQMKKEAFK